MEVHEDIEARRFANGARGGSLTEEDEGDDDDGDEDEKRPSLEE